MEKNQKTGIIPSFLQFCRALYGFCGMVRGVISAIERELGYAPKIVLTGGDASLLKNIGNIPGEQVDNLTFVGLLHVAQHLS